MYKIVRSINGRLYSAAVIDPQYRVEYQPGYFVFGKGPLFVFNNLEQAANCFKAWKLTWYTELWECECLGETEEQLFSARSVSEFDNFWKCQGALVNRTPAGTFVADQVMLTRRLK